MDKKEIRLTELHFNSQNGRWGIITSDDLWGYEGLHCGENTSCTHVFQAIKNR